MGKIEKLMKINFESKPVYGDGDKYIKTKIKIYAGSMITNFQSKKMPKEKAPCKCLSIIMLDSVVKVKKKYYSQTLLGECKYEIKKTKVENLTDDELEVSLSDDETDIASDDETESDYEKDNDEPNE